MSKKHHHGSGFNPSQNQNYQKDMTHKKGLVAAVLGKKVQEIQDGTTAPEIASEAPTPVQVPEQPKPTVSEPMPNNSSIETSKRLSEALKKQEGDAAERVKEILSDAHEQAVQITEEARKKSEDANSLLAESEARLAEAKKASAAMESEKLALVKEKAELESEKATYRLQIQDEVEKASGELAKKVQEATAKEETLNKKISSLQDDIETYKAVISSINIRQADLIKAKTTADVIQSQYDALKKSFDDAQTKIAEMEAARNTLGTDPLAYKAKADSLEKLVKDLQDKLANVPSQEEIVSLRADSEELAKLTPHLAEVQKQLTDLKVELQEAKINASKVDDYVRYIKILNASKEQLQNELDLLQDQYSKANGAIFKALSQFDKDDKPAPMAADYVDNLRDFCEGFRAYAANRHGDDPQLFYSIKSVRSFVSWLSTSKLLILEGLSGSGKTSLPTAFAKYAGWSRYLVPVQSSWKDKNDLIGFYNDFKHEYKETEFLKDLYKADRDPKRVSFIVLDEMNLSRIEYYFADFLSLLELDKSEWKIDLMPEKANDIGMPALVHEGKIDVSENVWFIGTANKDDSTFTITDKVYDRAGVIEFTAPGERDESVGTSYGTSNLSYAGFLSLCEKAAANYDLAGDKKTMELLEYLQLALNEHFSINIGNRILRQFRRYIPVYLACVGDYDDDAKLEAFDTFFPRKVLRKIEGLYDARTKTGLKEISDYLKSTYQNKLPNMVASLDSMLSKID